MSPRGARRARAWGGWLLAVAVAGCSAPGPAPPLTHTPTRHAYRAFAEGVSELYEPNYLPFMVHQHRPGPGRATLFFCRWPAAAMPLRVAVETEAIPDRLQRDFHTRVDDEYEDAIDEALALWERELEGLVGFRRVADGEEADIRVRLRAAAAPLPDPEKQVLGIAALAGACRVEGEGDGRVLSVTFAAPSVEIFLADAHGLPTPDQVHRVALHELGHALGMRGHSPIPADLMYAVARDRVQVAEGLSVQDVNSFLSLYSLPNGTRYGELPAPEAAPLPGDGVALARAPHVDARHGLQLRLPEGWTRFVTNHGVVAVDGTTWDYGASLQIAVQRYATIDDFLGRYGAYFLGRGFVSAPRSVEVDGRRALHSRIRLRDAPRTERVTLVEVGDGRLLVVTADAPDEHFEAYLPVFDAVLASLRIRDHPEDAWPPRR